MSSSKQCFRVVFQFPILQATLTFSTPCGIFVVFKQFIIRSLIGSIFYA